MKKTVVAGVTILIVATAALLLLETFRIEEHEALEDSFLPADEILIPTLDVENGWVRLSEVERELLAHGAIFTKEYHVPLHHLLFREGIEFEAGYELIDEGEGVDWGSEEELFLEDGELEALDGEGEDQYDEESSDDEEDGIMSGEEGEYIGEDGADLTKKQRKKLLKAERKAAKAAAKEEKRRAKEEKKWRNSHLLEIKSADLNSEARREMLEYASDKLSKHWKLPLPSWRNQEVIYLSQRGNSSQCPGVPSYINIHRYYLHPQFHGRSSYIFKSSSEDLTNPDSKSNSDLFLPESPKMELLQVLEHELHSCYHKWTKKSILEHGVFFKPLSICAHVNSIVPQMISPAVAHSELGERSIGLEANGTYWYMLVNEGHDKVTKYKSTIAIPYKTYEGAVDGSEMPLDNVKHTMRIWSTNEGKDPWLEASVEEFSARWVKLLKKLDAHNPCADMRHLQDDDEW